MTVFGPAELNIARAPVARGAPLEEHLAQTCDLQGGSDPVDAHHRTRSDPDPTPLADLLGQFCVRPVCGRVVQNYLSGEGTTGP